MHCALDELCEKICDIQETQEIQDSCLGAIKGTLNEHTIKLDTIIEITNEILDEIGNLEPGGPGTPNGNGCCDGPLVCINCGGSCCCDEGENCGCCCCPCEEPEPPIEPPGNPDVDPEPLCLISGENELNNKDIIELWF